MISLEKKIKEVEASLKEFETRTNETKIKKFQRDRKDYVQGWVYNWLYEKKKVTCAGPVDLSGDEGGSSRNLRDKMFQQRKDRGERGFRRWGPIREKQKL